MFRFGRFDSGEPVDVLVQRRDEPTRRVRAGALPRVAGQPAAPAVAATFFAEHDVLAVTYDRPGYGRSDPQPGRRVLDAAADVAALVDHLQLETFVVMGVSGGRPHTLACTYALPRAARGRRRPLVAILAMAAAAVLAGARSMTTIAEWAADAPQPVRTRASARHHAPSHLAVPAEATSAGPWRAWTCSPGRHHRRLAGRL